MSREFRYSRYQPQSLGAPVRNTFLLLKKWISLQFNFQSRGDWIVQKSLCTGFTAQRLAGYSRHNRESCESCTAGPAIQSLDSHSSDATELYQHGGI